jgi:hypothetical protein
MREVVHMLSQPAIATAAADAAQPDDDLLLSF